MAALRVSRTHAATLALIGIWVLSSTQPVDVQSEGTKISASRTKVSSPHLEITSYVTDELVEPGTHFSAVLDITPRPGIHVYAPEVQGYRPIRLTIYPRAGVLIRKAHYPRSEVYFFAALEEHVPVYQAPFRIVQDLLIDKSREGQTALTGLSTLTIKGVLDYQACDDRICFAAESVPLLWTIKLRRRD